MEHRHNREDAVPFRHRQRIRETERHAVEPQGAVGVGDALRQPGRGRRKTHAGGIPLVERRPLAERLRRREQRFVRRRAGQRRRIRGPVVHHDVALDGAELGGDRLQQRHEIRVHQQDAVLGVIDDVGQVRRRQTQVQGVQHRPDAGHREIRFQVAVMVPGERGDPIALPHAEGVERTGELPGALSVLAVGVPNDPGRGP